jgi:predicted RNA-binding Zn-ribbon protein involved in translation (DUF1610 family)
VVAFRKAPKATSSVTCRTCSREIPLLSELRQSMEFSVRCPNCGRRSIYREAEIHDLDDGAGAMQTFSSMEFSARKTEPAQSRFWLKEWASWLLQ